MFSPSSIWFLGMPWLPLVWFSFGHWFGSAWPSLNFLYSCLTLMAELGGRAVKRAYSTFAPRDVIAHIH